MLILCLVFLLNDLFPTMDSAYHARPSGQTSALPPTRSVTSYYDLRFGEYLGHLLRKNIFLLRFHCIKDSSTNKPGSEVKSSERPGNT